MSAANDNVLELLECPECGAASARAATQCWLCHAPLNPFREPPMVEARAPAAKPRPAAKALEAVFGTAFVASVVVVVLIGIGLAHDEPTALIPFIIFTGPPLVAVAVRESRLRAKGEKPTWGGRMATLFISAAATVGIAALLAVAAIVGLMLYCFSLMSRGSF